MVKIHGMLITEIFTRGNFNDLFLGDGWKIYYLEYLVIALKISNVTSEVCVCVYVYTCTHAYVCPNIKAHVWKTEDNW